MTFHMHSTLIIIEVFVFLSDPDLFVREVVEVVNEVVDPTVGGVDLALKVGLLVVRP